MNIPITKPFFDEREERALLEPLKTGWVVQGPKVKEFERAVGSYAGAGFAKATTSCTTALHLALIACGIGPGDEVILPSFTFIASANVVEYVGARPVFVDIDLNTFNIDTAQIEGAITSRTKAIMPVHLFGLCADMKPIMEIAAKHGLRVIEDAACAIGSFQDGKHAGTIGDAGCLSFHPRKSITTGEGGMVLTNSEEIAQKIEILRDHGAQVTDLVRHQGQTLLLPEYNMLGFNYRMTDFQGALGAAQMEKIRNIVDKKRRIAARYSEVFSRTVGLRPPLVPEGNVHAYQAYVCLFAPELLNDPTNEKLQELHLKRNHFMKQLSDAGISTRQGTHAVHALGYYRKKYSLELWSFPRAWIAENLSVALPLYPTMTTDEERCVCDQVKRCLRTLD